MSRERMESKINERNDVVSLMKATNPHIQDVE